MLLAVMFEMAQEPLKDFKMRDNQLYREESKVNVSLDAVRRDNPSLANPSLVALFMMVVR
jgi:cation transport regulator ChaB